MLDAAILGWCHHLGKFANQGYTQSSARGATGNMHRASKAFLKGQKVSNNFAFKSGGQNIRHQANSETFQAILIAMNQKQQSFKHGDRYARIIILRLHLRILEMGMLPFKPVGSCGRKGSAEQDWNLASLALQTTTQGA